MKKNLILFFSCTVLSLFLDLSSKFYAKALLEESNIVIFRDFLFTLKFNKGIAFSLPLTGNLQIIITILFLAIFLVFAHKEWQWQNKQTTIATALITGGALGNLYERILFQNVTDFIQAFSWYPVFNLADTFIFLGVFLLILFEWRTKKG
jgi:signal peptidase II